MFHKELKKRKVWYINFNIKKYNKIDDIINIISLIDKKIIGQDNINGNEIIVKINRQNNTQYDYICKTNIVCSSDIINEFLTLKFIDVQNFVKFNNSQFGLDWEINFELF